MRRRYIDIPKHELIRDFEEMGAWINKLNKMADRYRPQGPEYKALQGIHDAITKAGDQLIGMEDNPLGWVANMGPETIITGDGHAPKHRWGPEGSGVE